MKRIISFVLALIIVLQSTIVPVMAQEWTCSDYAECTEEEGSFLAIVVDEDTPVREKPNNKGNILARLQPNDFVSVTEVRTTKKQTIWYRIAAEDGSQAYIYSEHLVAHTEHIFVRKNNAKGVISLCVVCGFLQVETPQKKASCNLLCRLGRLIKGAFDDSDNDLVDVLAQIALGFTPVGIAADIRDFIAAAQHPEDKLNLILSAVAIIPGSDIIKAVRFVDGSDLKAINKVTKSLSRVDTFVDAKRAEQLLRTAEGVDPVIKKVPIVWTTWSEYLKRSYVDGSEVAHIGEHLYHEHACKAFLTRSQAVLYDSTGKLTPYVAGHSRGIPVQHVESVLAELPDDLNDAEALKKLAGRITVESTDAGKLGLSRKVVKTGTLKIVLEDSGIIGSYDTVVSIINTK